MRSSSVRCSDTAEGSCAHSGRAVLMAIRVSCPFVVGGLAGSPRGALHVAPGPGSPLLTTRLSLRRTVSAAGPGGRHLRWGRGWRNGSGGRGCAGACGARRCGRPSWSRSSSTRCCSASCRSRATSRRTCSRRSCSRSSSTSWSWRSGRRWRAASCAGAVRGCRRSSPTTARGRRSIGLVAVVVLAVGLAHHPAVEARARAFDLQAAIARAFVLAPRPGPLPGERQADGHVEAGPAPLPDLRPRPGRAAVVLRVRRHGPRPARGGRRPRPEPELGARRAGQPGAAGAVGARGARKGVTGTALLDEVVAISVLRRDASRRASDACRTRGGSTPK